MSVSLLSMCVCVGSKVERRIGTFTECIIDCIECARDHRTPRNRWRFLWSRLFSGSFLFCNIYNNALYHKELAKSSMRAGVLLLHCLRYSSCTYTSSVYPWCAGTKNEDNPFSLRKEAFYLVSL